MKRAVEKPKNSSFRILEKYDWTKNFRTVQFFPENMCQSKWSDRSLIRNFSRKCYNLPIEIRKKLSSEMVKLNEGIPIDRQVRDFE